MTRIDATFEITRWDAETYDAPAEGPPSQAPCWSTNVPLRPSSVPVTRSFAR